MFQSTCSPYLGHHFYLCSNHISTNVLSDIKLMPFQCHPNSSQLGNFPFTEIDNTYSKLHTSLSMCQKTKITISQCKQGYQINLRKLSLVVVFLNKVSRRGQ